MAFPTGWGRKCAITIDNTKVPASLTDFPVLITKDMLPEEMFDADGDHPALNGGGDIRFSSDADGATQLACEIVSFVTDNDPVNGSAEIHVKVPSLSSATDTVIYVWYNKAGESQPAVTDTYGRNAVWSNEYVAVFHLNNNATDSTGNLTGSFTGTSDATGKFGRGRYSNTLGNKLTTTSAASYFSSSKGTITCWVKMDAATPASGNDNHPFGMYFSGESGTNHYPYTTGAAYITAFRKTRVDAITLSGSIARNEWHKLTITTENTTNGWKMYQNTTLTTQVNGEAFTGGDLLNDSISILGVNRTDNINKMAGTGDEYHISETNRSADWISTEYNNQNSPSTFATAGTPETPGGFAYNQAQIIH